MTSITDTFNSQSYQNLFLIPLWITLIMESCKIREDRRKAAIHKEHSRMYQAEIDRAKASWKRQVAGNRPC